jgi:mono/diheme cytochrome c family protein
MRSRFLLIIVVGVMATTAVAALPGDAANGHRLAQRWCAQCHGVEAEPGHAPADGVPTFRAVAAKPSYDRPWLRAKLASPHAPMPDLSLTRAEIDDLGAWLDRLRP